jgi:precorrin-6B methylase 2
VNPILALSAMKGIGSVDMYSLKRLSLKAINLLRPLWTMLNDAVLNIRTMPPSPVTSTASDPMTLTRRGQYSRPAKHEDNYGYDSPEYWYIRLMVRRLKLTREDVFYDMGCGMGRVLCIMARRQIRKCVGIELLEPLCQDARSNALRLRGRKTPIEVICADAATADLSEGTVYYLYNPFGKDTLRDFLANLETSVSRTPRKVMVVYYNSLHESILKASGWLKKYDEFNTFSGQHVTFWESCGGQNETPLR